MDKLEIKRRLQQSPIEIGIEDITYNTSGRLLIAGNIDGIRYDSFFLKSIDCEKRLFVFLSAVGVYRDESTTFHRVMWASKFNGHALYIDDPMRKITKFAPCFYIGSKEFDCTKEIADIVTRFKSIYDIDDKNITFISSSNGGFASIKVSQFFKNCTVIALNPQISVPQYFKNKTDAESKLGFNFSDVVMSGRTEAKCEIDSKRNKILICSNLACDSDQDQMNLLSSWYNFEKGPGIKFIHECCDCFLFKIASDETVPHLIQPDENMVSLILNCEYFNLPKLAKKHLFEVVDSMMKEKYK